MNCRSRSSTVEVSESWTTSISLLTGRSEIGPAVAEIDSAVAKISE